MAAVAGYDPGMSTARLATFTLLATASCADSPSISSAEQHIGATTLLGYDSLDGIPTSPLLGSIKWSFLQFWGYTASQSGDAQQLSIYLGPVPGQANQAGAGVTLALYDQQAGAQQPEHLLGTCLAPFPNPMVEGWYSCTVDAAVVEGGLYFIGVLNNDTTACAGCEGAGYAVRFCQTPNCGGSPIMMSYQDINDARVASFPASLLDPASSGLQVAGASIVPIPLFAAGTISITPLANRGDPCSDTSQCVLLDVCGLASAGPNAGQDVCLFSFPAVAPGAACFADQECVLGTCGATTGTCADILPFTNLRGPDAKLVERISDFDVAAYQQELRDLDPNPWVDDGPLRQVALDQAIDVVWQSHNVDPPTGFGIFDAPGGPWDQFKATQEYRGLVHVANINARCRAGVLVPLAGREGMSGPSAYTDASGEFSDGFTKEGLFDGPHTYSDGEGYEGADFRTLFGDVSVGASCLTVTSQAAARLASLARQGQFVFTDFDAPFIWFSLRETMCCDGSVHVDVSRSAFPASTLYIDNAQLGEAAQLGIGTFITSGGDKGQFHPTGQGNLAPAGDVMSWTGQALQITE